MFYQENTSLMVRTIQYLSLPLLLTVLISFLDEDQMTQSVVTLDDVQEELKEKMKHKDIKYYTMEVVTKKYTFDLPDVPEETEYIRLRYSYNGKLVYFTFSICPRD